MKQMLFAFAALVFAACGGQQSTVPASEEPVSAGERQEVTFEVARNYFFNNDQQLPLDPRITTAESFNQLFGMATTMGEEGNPTEIDFDKQFVVAVVLPQTDVQTEITPVKVESQGEKLYYSFDITTGEKQSFTTRPMALIILDKQYEGKEVVFVNEQLRQATMEEVQAYLKECGAFFIATTDGDQPHVRPFGVSEIMEGNLYLLTGKVKDVYKQMAANGKFEICALKPSNAEWMRITGTLTTIETISLKEEFLNRNEDLKFIYKADDDNIALMQITDATVRFCSFAAPERRVHF
ncbi:MAG: pyridoxamine 5'-phosphate oxidase family protein [Bacteroidaceae bacterium]|nr:pyridoxamine 5'-phosphate oxidase family protein [Bacteroidaceae bacterium]